MGSLVTITLVIFFDIILCTIEIPKMSKNKLYIEFALLSVFLIIGTSIIIVKSIGYELPNPSDWIAFVYSPLKEVIKTSFFNND